MSKLTCEGRNSVMVSFMGGSILSSSMIQLIFSDINHTLLLGLALSCGVGIGYWIYKSELKKELQNESRNTGIATEATKIH